MRIPRKNIRPFHGKPIMAYSIEVARRAALFDRVYVSTEDPEIAQVAEQFGAAVIPRPLNLAEMNGAPDCGTQEVTRHGITWLQQEGKFVEYACCIYPCAPMITERDLELGFKAVQQPEINFVLPVMIGPTRDAGQFYWGKAWAFLARLPLLLAAADTYKLVLNPDRWVDINTEADWVLAEHKYHLRHGAEASA